MSIKTQARRLSQIPDLSLSYQAALMHLEALDLGPASVRSYVDALVQAQTLKLFECECGRSFYAAAGTSPVNSFTYGHDPRDGGPIRVIDVCPRCAQIYEMLMWFFSNYEDPAQGVPHEGREGGYQYVNGGPFYAPDVLQEHFDNRPHALVESACKIIHGYGPDWVRVGDY